MSTKLGKRTLKLAAMFTLHVLALLVVSLLISAIIIHALVLTGVLAQPSPGIIIFMLCLIALIIGAFMSRMAGRDVLSGVIETSEAARRVAQGDFTVRVAVDSRAEEVRSLEESFNRMASELERSEMLSTDFVNNVSHEFKTPLAAIEGYATLLQTPDLTPGKRDFYTEKILLSTRRLSELTGSILELSRLENSELKLERSPFQLDEQIRECILTCEGAWTEKNIELDVDLDEIVFSGNADLLARVWQNLIGNAVKFSPAGGRVSVSLKETSVGDDRSIIFTVTDEGPGMTAEQMDRIFEKFYQGETAHSEEGAGLGLALAKKIVDLHGGNIHVESETGRGSTFLVKIPGNQVES